MKNKDKYKKELEEFGMCEDGAPWRHVVCFGNTCNGCGRRLLEWCEQEAPPDLTGMEKEVLKAIDPGFKYIARDKDGKLFVYCRKPQKGDEKWLSRFPCTFHPLSSLFGWIRFEDEEPVCIDDYVSRQ